MSPGFSSPIASWVSSANQKRYPDWFALDFQAFSKQSSWYDKEWDKSMQSLLEMPSFQLDLLAKPDWSITEQKVQIRSQHGKLFHSWNQEIKSYLCLAKPNQCSICLAHTKSSTILLLISSQQIWEKRGRIFIRSFAWEKRTGWFVENSWFF